MSIRVHELAKRCGLSNKDMIEKLHTMHYPVKSHSEHRRQDHGRVD